MKSVSLKSHIVSNGQSCASWHPDKIETRTLRVLRLEYTDQIWFEKTFLQHQVNPKAILDLHLKMFLFDENSFMRQYKWNHTIHRKRVWFEKFLEYLIFQRSKEAIEFWLSQQLLISPSCHENSQMFLKEDKTKSSISKSSPMQLFVCSNPNQFKIQLMLHQNVKTYRCLWTMTKKSSIGKSSKKFMNLFVQIQISLNSRCLKVKQLTDVLALFFQIQTSLDPRCIKVKKLTNVYALSSVRTWGMLACAESAGRPDNNHF